MSSRVTHGDASADGTRNMMPDVPSPTLSTNPDGETTCPGLLGAVLHVARDALWSWNKAGVITSWNAEGEHLLGYTAQEIVGASISVLFPAEHLEQAWSVLLSVEGGNWYRDYNTIVRKKDGTPVSVKLTISSIVNYDHHVVGGLAICREQRPRRQTAAILARRVQELTALFKFSERLQNAGSLSEAYEAAVVSVLEAVQCDRAALLLLDAEGIMRFMAWHALSQAYRSAVEGHSPWKSDAGKPEPICIADVSHSSLPDPLKQIVAAEGIRGLAFIPVILDNKLIGKFMSYYNVPHHFSDAELTLALTVSRQLAVSIGRQRAAALEQTLTREVQHRSNNLLAVIQAIAQRSLSGNLSLEEAKEKFEARLHALARAHHNLMKSNWSRISLGDLVRSELEPFSARAVIQGPEILLGPQQAQSFSLALHELATNAVKHGALSSDSGRVMVDWFLGNSTELTFRWREEDGPAVTHPSRQGFGTTLLTSTFAKASLDYSPGGVRCELNVLLQGF